MKLITRYELATKTEHELYALHRKVFNKVARSKRQTLERVNALASLENIENELALRL